MRSAYRDTLYGKFQKPRTSAHKWHDESWQSSHLAPLEKSHSQVMSVQRHLMRVRMELAEVQRTGQGLVDLKIAALELAREIERLDTKK